MVPTMPLVERDKCATTFVQRHSSSKQLKREPGLRREMTWTDIAREPTHQKAKRLMKKMPSIFVASHV